MRTLGAPRPTPEQLRIIVDTSVGVEVIRGAAGSGKTTTALLRLRNLTDMFRARHQRLNINEPVRALVLTFNRTLSGYVEALARQQAAASGGVDIEVETFARWAQRFSSSRIIEDRANVIAQLAGRHGIRLAQDFLAQEVEYILGRFPSSNYTAYLDAERAGRGLSPRVERSTRERIVALIGDYRNHLRTIRRVDWEDLSTEAVGSPSLEYEIIVVDEAQDFSANQVRAVVHHLAATHALTLVIDTAQRLYPRGYTWAEAGINARAARFHRLAQNHRNTREIAAFAHGIIGDLSIDDDGTIPDLTSARRNGPVPTVFRGLYSSQLDAAIEYIHSNIDLTSETVAFLKPKGGGWFSEVRDCLTDEGIGFDEITREREWPSNDNNVVLSTMHSAKGLEFDHVIILGLSQRNTQHGAAEDDDQLHMLRRLLAMAVARARRSVVIGYKEQEASSLIEFFEDGTFEERDV